MIYDENAKLFAIGLLIAFGLLLVVLTVAVETGQMRNPFETTTV